MTTSNIVMGKINDAPDSLIVRGILEDLPPASLIIDCETIILNKKDLDISFKLDSAKIKNFDKLIINGVTFVKENI